MRKIAKGKPTPKKPEKKLEKKAEMSAPTPKHDELIVEEFDDPDAVQSLEPEEEEKPAKPIKKSNSNGFGMTMEDFVSGNESTLPEA